MASAKMELHERGINVGNDAEKMSGPTDPKALAEASKGFQGWLLAWDPVARKAAFRVEHKGPGNGGLLATGGDLLFQGLADGTFHAYDATNGKDLYVFDAKTGIVAPPVTYAVGGRQYVAVEVGWGGIFPLMFGELSKKSGAFVNHSRILVFALNGNKTLPAANNLGYVPAVPPATFDAAQVEPGHKNFANYCMACHGDNAVSGGVLPDLRWSGALKTREGFYNVVGRGSLDAYGMVAFKSVLDPAGIDAIRQYLIKRAQDTYPRAHAEAQARAAAAARGELP
jgi:mono/diheme cytochrome c family protein